MIFSHNNQGPNKSHTFKFLKDKKTLCLKVQSREGKNTHCLEIQSREKNKLFGASTMNDKPYAIIVDGNGKVTERKLQNHGPGTLLSNSIKGN